jgi:hypothetical protein
MIVIWRGMGAPIMMAGLVVIAVISILFDPIYWKNHDWPRVFACGMGGAVVFLLDWLRGREERGRDSLYFIPMKVWSFILLMVGICWSFTPTDSTNRIAGNQISNAQTATVVGHANTNSEPITTAGRLRLQGVFYSASGHSTAIINNRTVSAGDKLGDFTVSAIEPQSVKLLAAGGKERVLKLSDIGR